MAETFFQDKVAVVTGAGGTLCSEIAADLAARGAKVVLIGRSGDKLQKTAKVIEAAGGICCVRAGDVTDEKRMEEIAADVLREWGPCRFLVNGAGGNNIQAMTTATVYEDTAGKENARNLFDLDMGVFESVLKINTVGSVVTARVYGRQMLQEGGGSILNFASMNSYCPLTRVPAYAMGKAAIVNFTQWLAAYFGETGIRVNAVAPGFIVNERSIQYLGTPESGLTPRGECVMAHTPVGRFGQAKDLLGCVRWLLDDEASGFVTGITVPVDGGFLSRSGV